MQWLRLVSKRRLGVAAIDIVSDVEPKTKSRRSHMEDESSRIKAFAEDKHVPIASIHPI